MYLYILYIFVKYTSTRTRAHKTRTHTQHAQGQRAPNSMNKYGVVLNAIGMRPSFNMALARYVAALGALFFGADETRPTHLHGAPAHLEDWGGDTLNDHHTFIVRYRPDQDRHHDMHVDECDGTLQIVAGCLECLD